MQNCKECIYYNMIMEQPDYLENGKEINICTVFPGGIPAKIWDREVKCEEFAKLERR